MIDIGVDFNVSILHGELLYSFIVMMLKHSNNVLIPEIDFDPTITNEKGFTLAEALIYFDVPYEKLFDCEICAYNVIIFIDTIGRRKVKETTYLIKYFDSEALLEIVSHVSMEDFKFMVECDVISHLGRVCLYDQDKMQVMIDNGYDINIPDEKQQHYYFYLC